MTDDTPQYPRYPSEDDVPRDALPPAPRTSPLGPPPAPPGWHARPLGALTALTGAGAVLFTAFQLPRFWLAQDAVERWEAQEARGGSALDVWTPYEMVDAAAYLLLLGVYVTTCLWLWRVRTNVEVLSPWSPHARRRGWVWAGWLVPVVSFWFPYQVVRDALRVRSHRPGAATTVGWWWGVFLTATLVTGAESAFVPVDDIDVDLVSSVPPVAAVSTVAYVVACALWLRVVRAIAADQDTLLATP